MVFKVGLPNPQHSAQDVFLRFESPYLVSRRGCGGAAPAWRAGCCARCTGGFAEPAWRPSGRARRVHPARLSGGLGCSLAGPCHPCTGDYGPSAAWQDMLSQLVLNISITAVLKTSEAISEDMSCQPHHAPAGGKAGSDGGGGAGRSAGSRDGSPAHPGRSPCMLSVCLRRRLKSLTGRYLPCGQSKKRAN